MAVCPRCGYTWTPRKSQPVTCPNCQKPWPLGRDPARFSPKPSPKPEITD